MDLGADSLFRPQRRGSSNSVVRLVPPSRHLVPSLTGGLRRLYQNIKVQEVVVSCNCESYTDSDGCFCPVEKMPLLADRYEYIEVIGQGQSSILLKAKDTFQGDKNVAIKILHTHYSILGSQEASCLRSLNSADPHGFSPVLRLLNTFSICRHFCLVFELLHRVSLVSFFQEKTSPQERLRCIRKVALRLVNAVGFLQSQNVIHADLKPDNLRLSEKGELASLKVVDFGNAIHCIHDELSLYYEDFELQTLLYRAPEVIFGMMFGVEVDMWSIGCILAELYLGKPLFQGKNVELVLAKMQSLLGPLPQEIFQRGKFFQTLEHFTKRCVKPVVVCDVMHHLDCTDFAFVDFLLRLLKFDPASRMTVGQAAEHPFLAAELGLKFFQLAPSYESNVGYPKTFLNPEIYRHSLKQPKLNGASDLLSPSTLQNLEALSLPRALKFLPRKIELLNNSGILSKPDVICQTMGGLRSGERSSMGYRWSSKSREKLETKDNNNGSFHQMTIKIEPDEVEISTSAAEALIERSGPDLSTEISRTGKRSTERSQLGLVVSKELKIVSSAVSDADKGAKVTKDCEFQRRRFNFDHIQNLSETELVPTRDHSDFDKLPDGILANNRKTAEALPRDWDAKGRMEVDRVNLQSSKHNPGVMLVQENGQKVLSRSLEDGGGMKGKRELMRLLKAQKSPENESRSGTSVESLRNVESKRVEGSCVDLDCGLGSHGLDSQPVSEESSLASSCSGRRSCRPMSQSEEDVRKVKQSFLNMETVSDRERAAHTSLTWTAQLARESYNPEEILKAVAVKKAASRNILLSSNVHIAEEPVMKNCLLDGRNVENTAKPTLSILDIWQSLSQKKATSNENPLTVIKKNTVLQEASTEIAFRIADDESERSYGQSSCELDSRGALKQSTCDPMGKVNSEVAEVVGDVDSMDLHPARLASSRKLYRGSTNPLSAADGARKLPLCEGQETESSPGCAGQQSLVYSKEPLKNSQLDSTFVVEESRDVRRVLFRTPERQPHQTEKMQQSETTHAELPRDASSCRKNAQNASHCLNATFSRSPIPHDHSSLGMSCKHKSLSSTDSPVTNSHRTNCVNPIVLTRKVIKSSGLESSIADPNVPEIISKDDTELMQQISSSDSRTSPPKKRQKLDLETKNQAVHLQTPTKLAYFDAKTCNADSKEIDSVCSSELATKSLKTERMSHKEFRVKRKNAVSKNPTIADNALGVCNSSSSETVHLNETFLVQDKPRRRRQHNYNSSPGGLFSIGFLESLTYRTNSRNTRKSFTKANTKQKALRFAPANGKSTPDADASGSCGSDESGYTLNKTSSKPANNRSPDSRSVSTVCLSAAAADDDEEEDCDEVVTLTP